MRDICAAVGRQGLLVQPTIPRLEGTVNGTALTASLDLSI